MISFYHDKQRRCYLVPKLATRRRGVYIMGSIVLRCSLEPGSLSVTMITRFRRNLCYPSKSIKVIRFPGQFPFVKETLPRRIGAVA